MSTPAETPAENSAQNPAQTPGPVVRARGLELRAGGRTVFSGLDLDVPAGATLVVRGPASAGKTSLLLTLAGRMRPTGGELTVLGEPLPARAGRVRRRVALAEVRGVNELDDALTVEQHIAERLVLHRPWHRPWVTAEEVAEQLRRVQEDLARTAGGGPASTLRAREFVSDLQPLERLTLGVVLALVGRPDVLVVDDVDSLRRTEDRRRAWTSLAALQETGDLTVLASCSDSSDIPWRTDDGRILLDLQDEQ
ncbi:ATP-binding cassette domain-containing protein [Kineococcus sp. LSe6-4]|uniref:ATP-binding cassette domain-containing protein n=1 Tax=Kineococcus halophytocola TaxID=3234027 RepID=A0ABV4H1I5_9ACTN